MWGKIKMIKILESQNAFGTMNTGTIMYSNLTDVDKARLSKRKSP